MPSASATTTEVMQLSESAPSARELLCARTERIDAVCRTAAQRILDGTLSCRYVLLAVGGYGRKEIYPYSDIDLLLVVETEPELQSSDVEVRQLNQTLWDSGIGKISLRARTVAQCCTVQQEDVEFHISLLDERLIAGDSGLYQTTEGKLRSFFQRNSEGLSRQLAARARRLHAKFGDTVYHLEPNVKDGPGGLRDIHVLHWLYKLAPQREVLRESSFGLADCAEFLAQVRYFLHERAGRDQNVLSFEMQEEGARALDGDSTPEVWMRRYYGHARRVAQSASRALDYVEEREGLFLTPIRAWRTRSTTPDYTIAYGRLLLRNPPSAMRSAESIFDIFTFAGRHGVRLAWDTQRRLQADLPRLGDLFSEKPPGWSTWRDLLSQPFVGLALGEMQESGVLQIALPEWSAVDSLVVRDFYHRYTVDEHTIIAIDTIDQIAARKPNVPERFRDLCSDPEDYLILRLALLLHDIGKGTTPGDHVRGSLESGDVALKRMAVPEPIKAAVLFLIEQHLLLSVIMNSRDLQDPATARHLSAQVPAEEDLRRLVLFTYADINAVNPSALSPWRVEQLWRVYVMGANQLTRELNNAEAPPGELTKDLSDGARDFVRGFPFRYVRTHTAEEIERHWALAEQVARKQIVTDIVQLPGAYGLTLAAGDSRGLFAAVCGTLSSFGLNIVKAEAAANSDGIALDFFRFTDPMKTLELNPSEVQRLQWTLERVVRGKLDVIELLQNRPPHRRVSQGAALNPSVRLDNDASETATLAEFTGEDRPGLLYHLASSITNQGCDIGVVMISTEAHKATDVFYLTCGGRKLSDDSCRSLQYKLTEAASAI